MSLPGKALLLTLVWHGAHKCLQAYTLPLPRIRPHLYLHEAVIDPFWRPARRRRAPLASTRPPVGGEEDIFAAVHRKEYEMSKIKARHTSTTDPVRMAMSYAQESVSPMRLARALRRVYEDPTNPANPQAQPKSPQQQRRDEQLKELGMVDLGLRRASVVIDIKRQSLLTPPPAFFSDDDDDDEANSALSLQRRRPFCHFDDAGMVAEAMVRLGADAVMINTDYTAYGGDWSELASAVRAVRRVSSTAAVILKDIVVDEIQLGLAKQAGADAILLMSCVLGPALENFLNVATSIGLETVVECHTMAEVQQALELLAPTILVNNYDRLTQTYHPEQALRLAGLFPGSGGPVISLATGGLSQPQQIQQHLAAGYDGVVLGRAVMGSTRAAPHLIRTVRDRTLLPAEMSQWGIDAEFDIDGNLMAPTTNQGSNNSENNSLSSWM